MEKIIQRVSSNGRIVIPKQWRDKLGIHDDMEIELILYDDNTILLSRNVHPLEIEDELFAEIDPFTDEELKAAKKSLFPYDH